MLAAPGRIRSLNDCWGAMSEVIALSPRASSEISKLSPLRRGSFWRGLCQFDCASADSKPLAFANRAVASASPPAAASQLPIEARDRPGLSISLAQRARNITRQIFVLGSKIRQQSSQPSDWLSLSHVPETGGGIAVVIRFDVRPPCGGRIDNSPSFVIAGQAALAVHSPAREQQH